MVQNQDFKRFHRYTTAQRKGCRENNCNLYDVTATITGRFDSVPTTLCPDQKHQCPAGNYGFGHMGFASARLVIQSVSEVVARPAIAAKR